jgi:ferredoxin
LDFKEIREDSAWPSWYPVIDTARCTNCGQCADFCLFGVYEKAEAYPEVINPQACKNNCPACARICPSAAIIFPKYIHGGAIGGSDEIDEKAEQERQARDIENILGDDLYEALERRRARRKSIIREEAMMKAMAERDKALGISSKN